MAGLNNVTVRDYDLMYYYGDGSWPGYDYDVSWHLFGKVRP